jgi:hypothetical protein
MRKDTEDVTSPYHQIDPVPAAGPSSLGGFAVSGGIDTLVVTFGAASSWSWPEREGMAVVDFAAAKSISAAAGGPEIVAAGRWRDLGGGVLDTLHQLACRPNAPGVSLLLRDEEQAVKDALFAAPRAAPQWRSEQVALLNELDAGAVSEGSWRVFGKVAPAEQVRDALGSAPELVLVSAHGDGLDCRLPGGLQLCSKPWATVAACGQSPHCAETGDCYWTRLDRRSREFAEAVVGPEEIAARVVVLNTCFGIQSGASLFDPGMVLARRIAEVSHCEYVICFQGYAIEDTQAVLDMCGSIAAGAPVAAAVAGYNRTARSQALGRRAFVLPGSCWQGPERDFPASAPADVEIRASPSPAAGTASSPLDDLDLHDWLAACVGGVQDSRVAAEIRRLQRDPEAAGPFADLLASIDTSILWPAGEVSSAAADAGSCAACGAPLHQFLSRQAGRTRMFAQCFNCSHCSDSDGLRRFRTLRADGEQVVVEALRPIELRVRFNPAGSPKFPLDIVPASAARTLSAATLDRTCAFAAALSPGERISLSPFAAFKRPVYFITLAAVDAAGYASETYTANFGRARQGAESFSARTLADEPTRATR